MTRFASTSFGSTPDDKAVAVDVYGKPPLTPVNQQKNVLLDGLNSFLGSGTLGGALVKELTNNYLTTGKLINLSADGAIKGAAAALGIPNGNLYDVGGATLDAVLKGTGFYGTGLGDLVDGISTTVTGNSLEKNLLGGYRDVMVTVDNTQKLIKDVQNADSFTDLAKVLSGIDGNSNYLTVFDLTEAAGVIKGVSDLSTELGIPGTMDKMFNNLDDGNKYYVASLIASGTTNWNSLENLDVLLDNLTGAELLNANPNVISALLYGYCPTVEYPNPSKEAADALIQRLVKIDPQWHSYRTAEGKYISNMDVFIGIGDFAKESFILGGYHLQEIAIVPGCGSKTFWYMANDKYPYIGLPV